VIPADLILANLPLATWDRAAATVSIAESAGESAIIGR